MKFYSYSFHVTQLLIFEFGIDEFSQLFFCLRF